MFDWNFSPSHTSSEPFSQTPVRASTELYLRFTLDMARSHGFRSTACNCRPVKTRFPSGSAPEALNLASIRNSPDRSTKSTRSRLSLLTISLLIAQSIPLWFHSKPFGLLVFRECPCKLRSSDAGPRLQCSPYVLFEEPASSLFCTARKLTLSNDISLPQLVNIWFQVLFHSPPGVLFTFPSQYYALSVTKKYLGLRGGPRSFRQGFTCLVLLWIPPCQLGFRVRDFHPLWSAFPKLFCYPH